MKRIITLKAPELQRTIGDYEIRLRPVIITTVKRIKPKAVDNPGAHFSREIFEFADRINLSAAYKSDCKRYIKAYNAMYQGKGKYLSSWPGLWMKIMFEQRKSLPELSPKLITRELALDAELDFISICKAVEAGLLEPVTGCEYLTNLI
jgi:hypothetical protein